MISNNYFYLIIVICLCTVTILNINNFQLYGITYPYWICVIFKQIYLAHRWGPNRYTTPSVNGLGGKGNEGVFHSAQISKLGAFLTNAVYYHTQESPFYRRSHHPAGWFGLVLFYGISTTAGHLMPNPF